MARWKFWKKEEEAPIKCNDLDHLILIDKAKLMDHQVAVVIAQNELLKEELEYYRDLNVDKQSYA